MLEHIFSGNKYLQPQLIEKLIYRNNTISPFSHYQYIYSQQSRVTKDSSVIFDFDIISKGKSPFG